MKIQEISRSPIRIAILTAIGLAQFLLAMYGCIHIASMLGVTAQWVSSLGVGVGLLSLIYPIYILMAFDPPTRESMKIRNDK